MIFRHFDFFSRVLPCKYSLRDNVSGTKRSSLQKNYGITDGIKIMLGMIFPIHHFTI